MGNRIRGAAAAIILLAAVVGLPLTLAETVGNPLRQWQALRAGDSSDAVVIAMLATVFYLAWASFVVPLIIETVTLVAARITGRPARRLRLPLLGAQHDLARALLGTILLLAAPTAVTVTPLAAALPATAQLTASTSQGPAPATSPEPVFRSDVTAAAAAHRRYVIPPSGGMRSYWDLARHFLGDGNRWREIWQLNAGRVHSDGTVMDTPRRLAAGWTLLIPDTHAAAPRPQHGIRDVTVEPGDTLSGIAAADGISDWHRVWADNAHRSEPNGRTFDDPDLILPGWTISVPAHSRDVPTAPAEHVPTQQSPHPDHRDAATTTRTGPPSDPPTQALTTETPPRAGIAPRTSPGTSQPAAASHRYHDQDGNPLPIPLEIGLGALATVTALDRARRIAQRRRRPGRRIPPPRPPLAAVERQLRRDARLANPAVAAVQLATALTAAAPVAMHAAVTRDDGAVDLLLTAPADPPPPFTAVDGGWRLTPEAVPFTVAADDPADPYPTLVPVGRDQDGSVLVDLATASPVAIAGDPAQVHRYLARLVLALAGAPWAERVTIHIPSTLAALVAPVDRVHVDDTPSPPAGAVDGAAEIRELGWCTTPIDVYCGYAPDDAGTRLVDAATASAGTCVVILNGLHPRAALWTLDGDQLALPHLPAAVTIAGIDDEQAVAVADLITHSATVDDVPVGDPQLPDHDEDAPAAGTDTAMQLNILGPVELTGTEQPRRSQTLNLLVYLALHRRGADRDQIATALWPEQLVSTKTLRNRIHEARVLVGHAISDGPRWRLDDSITTDWQRFTALARGSHDQQHQALSLVRGRPFAGLDDTEWIDHEGFRSEVEAAIVDLALTVAADDLAAGNYDAAYTAARAGLAASRYDERLHRLAIRAAHAQGATGKVRSQQREMRTVLDSDVEPDDHVQPETIALYDELETTRANRPV